MPIKSRALTATITPPVKGWNTEDPISDMDPLYALELENFFPRQGTVDLRGGNTIYATGIGASNKYSHSLSSTAAGFVAWSNESKPYSINSSGAGTDISGGVSLTNTNPIIVHSHYFVDRVFFKTNSTGDDLYYWTGTGNIGAPAFVGPGGDDKDLGVITSYRSRLYAPQVSSQILWYGGVEQVVHGGTNLNQFSVKGVLNNTIIQAIAPITRGKQTVEDSMLLILGLEGRVLVYSGDYPGSATWYLACQYDIPTPVGSRPIFNIGSDTYIMTDAGIISVNKILAGEFKGYSSDYITRDITSAWTAFAKDGYVQATYHPTVGYVIINTLTTAETSSTQFVWNATTGAWCKFTNQFASNFAVRNNELYFSHRNSNSDGGKVYKAEDGYVDNAPLSGQTTATARTIKLRSAYNYFGDRRTLKQFHEARPLIYQSEGLALTMDMDVDYANVAATQTVTPETTDTAYKLYTPRVGLKGIGKCASIRIDQTVTTKRMSLQATEVMWNEGDIQG